MNVIIGWNSVNRVRQFLSVVYETIMNQNVNDVSTSSHSEYCRVATSNSDMILLGLGGRLIMVHLSWRSSFSVNTGKEIHYRCKLFRMHASLHGIEFTVGKDEAKLEVWAFLLNGRKVDILVLPLPFVTNVEDLEGQW